MDIDDSALVAAARLSDRYVTGRHLPDKAVDFIDEAASKLRIDVESLPADIKNMETRIAELLDQEEAAAQRTEYERAAEIRVERLRLEDEYESERGQLQNNRRDDMVVNELDIAELVSKWTGIPTGRLLEGESERLIHMEEDLHLDLDDHLHPTFSDEALRAAMEKAGAVADYTKENFKDGETHFSTLHIFDDSMNDGQQRHSRAFSDLFVMGRHDFTSVLWLCHSWRQGLHPTARKQLSALYCFRLRNNADRSALFGPSGELSIPPASG